MNLFEFDKIKYMVHPTEEALLLKVFSDIWKRDKSKDKVIALRELGFVWFYCDVKSPHLTMEEPDKTKEIIKDLDLPKEWKKDKVIDAAINYYNSHKSKIEEMYEGALMVAQTITEVCKNSREYITTSEDKIAAAQKLNAMLKELPTSMEKLKAAEQQHLKEIDDKSGKKKGSQTYNTYEDMQLT
jgi:hypothetical protein